jgi:aspartyl-tRNA(Asn)/glutamyl-tRNA(Gln) amidotransferase subunit A
MSLSELSVCQLRDGLASGQFSSLELTRACLAQIDRCDPNIGAFLLVDSSGAEQQAQASDQRRSAGKTLGPLDGIPVAIKDVLCTAGQRTTCSSRMLENFVPPYDATAIARLRQAGLVLIGKTNMDEFAMGGSTENSALGVTRNPWNLDHVPGGSSGGAAACLAARMVPLSIGSDTGGSIRQPAAYCGVVGLKPTYGRVSRFGLVAFASSLDQVGPMAHHAADTALLLEAIAGHDPRDSTSAPDPVPAYTDQLDQPLTGLKLGIVPSHFERGLDAEVEAAVRNTMNVFRDLGCQTQEVELPHDRFGVPTYYVIAPCEASGNLARYDGVHYGYRTDEHAMLEQLQQDRQAAASDDDVDSALVRMFRQTRAEGFGKEVQRRVMLGTFALSAGYYDAYYLKALQVRRLIRDDYLKAFQQVDMLIGPTTPTPAFRAGEKLDDPLAMYQQDLYTVSANLAGLPGISFPCGSSTAGLPIGVQLQAPHFQEGRLLQAVHAFQQATDWHTKTPELP